MAEIVSSYPNQRTTRKFKKNNKGYRKNTADFIINQAISLNDKEGIDDLYEAARGNLKLDNYKTALNPYNSTDPKFNKFPATMRNYDIIRPIIRRYLGEFIKQVHNFQVKIANSDVIMLRNQYIAAEVTKLAMEEFRRLLAEQQAQMSQEVGNNAPRELPDFGTIVNDIKRNYIDERAVKGQDILEAIQDWTDSTIKYYQSFYDFIVTGTCYSYRDVRGDVLIKDIISPYKYYPISNGEYFVEDHDMGVCIDKYSYEQIVSKLGHLLEDEDLEIIHEFINNGSHSSGNYTYAPLSLFKSKYDEQEYSTFIKNAVLDGTSNNVLVSASGRNVEVAHVVYKTEVPVWFVKGTPKHYGLSIKDFEDAVFDDTIPDEYRDSNVTLEKDYVFETWEIYRIGDTNLNIYTIPQPVICQRRDMVNPANVKLPYNGISELLVDSGTFSIPDFVASYQIARNIIFYAREKVIGKNKDKVILMPQSLVSTDPEEKLWRMAADGVLRYDDSEDKSGNKQGGFRALDLSSYNYIRELTEIGRSIKEEAWDAVDMNSQRAGDIAQSAGAGTTKEAIVRSSMGSVIIFTMFDKFREKDYQADLDYSKIAYSENNLGQYIDSEGNIKNLEFNIDDHINTMYGIHVKNSQIENDKFTKLEGVALAASQNGNFDLAIQTVNANSVAKLSSIIRKYEDATKEYEQQQAQREHENAMMLEDKRNELEDKKFTNELTIEQVKQDNENYRKELEVGVTTYNKNVEGVNDKDVIRRETDALNARMKERELLLKDKQHNDNIKLKRDSIASAERIAKMNKNKYDAK